MTAGSNIVYLYVPIFTSFAKMKSWTEALFSKTFCQDLQQYSFT